MKKILCLLLSVLMAFSVFPVAIAATTKKFVVDGNLDSWYLSDFTIPQGDTNAYYLDNMNAYKKSDGVTDCAAYETQASVYTAYDSDYVYFYIKVWDDELIAYDETTHPDSSYADSLEIWFDPDPDSRLSNTENKEDFFRQTQQQNQGDIQVRLIADGLMRHDYHDVVKPGYGGVKFGAWVEDPANFCPFTFNNDPRVFQDGNGTSHSVSSGYGVEARFPRNTGTSSSYYQYNIAVNNSNGGANRYALANGPAWWLSYSSCKKVYYNGNGPFFSQQQTPIDSLTIDGLNSATISRGGEVKYYDFTPQIGGTYVMYSLGQEDTTGYLYNKNGSQLTTNDDDGEGYNFRWTYSLNAGTTYKLGVKYNNSSQTGNIPFYFGKVNAPDMTYVVENGSIMITDYTGQATHLSIPRMVEGLPVTQIGSSSFAYCSTLESVTIPEQVTLIGDGAFYEDKNLSMVTLPDGILSIGKNAFDSRYLQTIYGYRNTVAQQYANEHGILFVALDAGDENKTPDATPATNQVTFQIDSVEGKKDDIVQVKVNLLEANTMIGALEGALKFDSAILQLIADVDGETLTAGEVITAAQALYTTNGERFAVATHEGLTQSGLLFTATFRVLKTIPQGEKATIGLQVKEVAHCTDKTVTYDLSVAEGGIVGMEGVLPDQPQEPDQPDQPSVTVWDEQFRSMDDFASLAFTGGTEAVPETANYVEGKGAIRAVSNGGAGFFFHIYVMNHDSSFGKDLPDGEYLTFDLYVSDASAISGLSAGDAGCNMLSEVPSDGLWDGNGYGVINSGAVRNMFSALKTGWNHVSLPINRGMSDTLWAFRLYHTNWKMTKNAYVIIDDVRIMNTAAVETVFPKRNLAKDATVAIRNIPAISALTLADKSIVDKAANAYEQVDGEYKNMVVGVAHLTAAQEKLANLQVQADKQAADQKAADGVKMLISALQVTSLEDKAAVQQARDAYEALTDDQKALVNNLSVLKSAEDKIQQLQAQADKQAADQKAADQVMALIAVLKVDSLEDKAIVQQARDAYEALTDDQKALVNNLSALQQAEEKIRQLEETMADQKVADLVIALIAGLPIDITLQDENMVVAVRGTYEALSESQKTLVANLPVLEAAENRIQELLADKAAAQAVMDLIDALPTYIDYEDIEKVKAVREAYEALTDPQKALVTNLDVLKNAEDQIVWIDPPLSSIYGDVNSDGIVDAVDALICLQAAIGKQELTPQQEAVANVSGDDVLDAVDALLILQAAVGKIDQFPVQG